MTQDRDDFVGAKLESMTLEEKVGQLLTFTWRGALLTPSGIEQITKLERGRPLPRAVRTGNLQESLLGQLAARPDVPAAAGLLHDRPHLLRPAQSRAQRHSGRADRGPEQSADAGPGPAFGHPPAHHHRLRGRLQERLHGRRHSPVPVTHGSGGDRRSPPHLSGGPHRGSATRARWASRRCTRRSATST